jgi:hypothetical protein
MRTSGGRWSLKMVVRQIGLGGILRPYKVSFERFFLCRQTIPRLILTLFLVLTVLAG